MVDTPPGTPSLAVHEALLKQILEQTRDIREDVATVKHAVSRQAQRQEDLERRHEEHTVAINGERGLVQSLEAQGTQLTRISEQVSTLRVAVYGFVGISFIGMLGTAGTALVWAIQHMGHGP